MPKKTNEEMQTTPDLDQAMKDGQITFDGENTENAAAPFIPGTPGPEEKPEEKEEEKPEAKIAPEGESPEEIAARTKKEDMPPETDFRFKNHPEAEKGYRELQGRTTKAEQRAKAVEAELDRIKNADRIKAETEATRATIVDFAATRKAQALEAIDALDPEDTEYRKKAATCLSQADIDIYEHYQTHGRIAPAETETQAKTDSDTVEMEPARDYVKKQIVGEGFDENDPLFWQYAARAPITDEKGMPTTLDKQIEWAVLQTKQYHNSIRTKLKTEEETRVAADVRKKQEADLPLGRGTSGGRTTGGRNATEEEDKPVSLSDAIEFAQDQRRL